MAPVEPAVAAACPRCGCHGKEVYNYMHSAYVFDVDRARALVSDGREPVELEEESVRGSVDHSRIHDDHVAHVNPSFPGIIAYLSYLDVTGDEVEAHLLIDGNHRAARCLRDQRPYYAYLLTPEESRAVLLRGPDRLDTDPYEVDLPGAADLHEETTRAYARKYATSLPGALRTRQVLAGISTHDRRGLGPFAVQIRKADGPRKWDVAGQVLLDYVMGQGALLLGHNFPRVTKAVVHHASLGSHLGAGHPLELRWAEMVQKLVPSAERVRFTASGNEATLLAFRVARAYSGRPRILRLDQHYHGWHDEALAHCYSADHAGLNSAAVAQVAMAIPAELDIVERLLQPGDTAAVILEPGGGAAGALPWSTDYLRALRDLTQNFGTLLIFDEASSGFRHGPGGVQRATRVTPDLTTLSKALGGGLPAGALVGRTDIMAVFGDGTYCGPRLAQVPHHGTFNAHPLSAAAGIALLEEVANGTPQERARQAAERLVRGVNELAQLHRLDVHLYTNGSSAYHVLIGAHRAEAPQGPSPAFVQLYNNDPRRYALLRRALLLEGLDTGVVHGWVSAVHDDEAIDESLRIYERAFYRLREVDCLQRK
jgi:glutamate-1-semialdehyde 2,1-aminomutase